MKKKFKQNTQQIKHKPIPEKVLKELRELYPNPYMEITLNTGARLNELWYIVNNYDYDTYPDTIEAPVKKQKHKGVFYINKNAKSALRQLKERNKTILSRSTLIRRLNLSLKKLGEYSNHNLRSYFCTSLLNKGIDLKTISILMHHQSIEQTAKYLFVNEKKLFSSISSICDNFSFEGLSKEQLVKELYRLRRVNLDLIQKNNH